MTLSLYSHDLPHTVRHESPFKLDSAKLYLTFLITHTLTLVFFGFLISFQLLRHGGLLKGSLPGEACLVDIKLHLDTAEFVPLLFALQTGSEGTTDGMAQPLSLQDRT